jgi:hypothetical protein
MSRRRRIDALPLRKSCVPPARRYSEPVRGLRRSVASNAAGLHIPFLRQLRYFPVRTTCSALLLAFLSLCLAKGIHSAIFDGRGRLPQLLVLGIVATAVFMNFLYGTRWHFLSGDLNPALVVSVTPPLAAVYTDLGRRPPYPAFPVIKIVRLRLHGLDGGPTLRVGEKLVMVSVYLRDARPGAPAWGDIKSLPAFVATGDPVIHRLLAKRLGDAEWDQLDFHLQRVPKPYQKGLYKMKAAR